MGWKGWTFVVLILALGGFAWSGGLDGVFGGEEKRPPVAGDVRRGVLDITVVERGNLKAANSTVLKSEIEGRTTILLLADEGTMVQPGDLLCELDATEMVEKRVSQEISVQNSNASWVKATQNLEIQKSKNESDLAKAERTRSFAEMDKKKYLEGDWLTQEQDARDSILIAEEELKRADDTLVHSKGLFDKGFLTRTEYEADELAKKRKEIALEQAKRKLDVLLNYDHPRRLEELDADIVEANRELLRVGLEATARLVDYEAEVRSTKARDGLELEKLTRLDDQIAKAKIYAPVAGMVVHAQPEGGRMSQGDPLIEGSEVRERQDLITIPSSEGMVAEVSLHESVLEKVQVGMPCTVSIDALPGVSLRGTVRFKAVLPDKNSWMANPNQRLYRTTISVLDFEPRLRPGMSCSIEIHVESLPDATYVPVQAIFTDGDQEICFLIHDDGSTTKRPVKLGSFNAVWAQILEGLETTDRVALSLPEGESLKQPTRDRSNSMPEGMEGMESGMGGGGYSGASLSSDEAEEPERTAGPPAGVMPKGEGKPRGSRSGGTRPAGTIPTGERPSEANGK